MSRALDGLGLGALVASVVAVIPLVPDWPWWHLGEPSYEGLIGLVVSAVVILSLHARGRRGSRFERLMLACFLAGMPLVYVADWLLASDRHPSSWLAVELGGLGVFATLAVLGVRRSSWFLAAGIAGHGVGWDLWHHGVGFAPDWYATGCLLADLGIGVYAATQVRAFQAAAHLPRSR